MNRAVLVTGAAGGLGWALAKRFYEHGYSLLLTDMQTDLLAERAEELASRGEAGRVVWLAGDITDPDHRAALMETLEQCFSGLQILVNNAGITHRSPLEKTDPAVLGKVMAVDWHAPLALALLALPLLRESRGSIINIGSMAGWMPVLGRGGYCAAKAALAQSFEVLRCEQKRHGVHVLMAYPSFLDTPIEQHALGFDGQPARHARSMVGKMKSADWMAGRIIRAEEKRDRRVYSDRVSRLGSLLWRIAPDLYLRLMMKKFAVELEQ